MPPALIEVAFDDRQKVHANKREKGSAKKARKKREKGHPQFRQSEKGRSEKRRSEKGHPQFRREPKKGRSEKGHPQFRREPKKGHPQFRWNVSLRRSKNALSGLSRAMHRLKGCGTNVSVLPLALSFPPFFSPLFLQM